MKHLIAATALTAFLPALLLAQKTSFDFDKATDFAKYRTYALKEGTPVGDTLIDNRITAAIETELVAKGLTKNDAAPDVVVVYHMAFDKEQEITSYDTGYGGYGAYGYRWGGGWGTTEVR